MLNVDDKVRKIRIKNCFMDLLVVRLLDKVCKYFLNVYIYIVYGYIYIWNFMLNLG